MIDLVPAEIELPQSDSQFADFTPHLIGELREQIVRFCDAVEAHVGPGIAHNVARSLLVSATDDRELNRFNERGWQAYIEEEGMDPFVDWIQLTLRAVEYARLGISPNDPPTTDLGERQRRIEALIERGRRIEGCGAIFLGEHGKPMWEAAFARHALDFDKPVPIGRIPMLAGISLAAVQNAVSARKLPVNAGYVSAKAALAWLRGRREFVASRWRNPTDDMTILSDSKKDREGKVFVPREADTDFTPKHVVRLARQGGGLSITVGPKGAERRFNDYYNALSALAKMDIARWRRRNANGSWGIVRGRGTWIAVDKAEIDRQLADIKAGR